MENENFNEQNQQSLNESMARLEKTVDEVGVGSLRFADGELVMFSVQTLKQMIAQAEEKQVKRVFFFINLDQGDQNEQPQVAADQ